MSNLKSFIGKKVVLPRKARDMYYNRIAGVKVEIIEESEKRSYIEVKVIKPSKPLSHFKVGDTTKLRVGDIAEIVFYGLANR